MSWIDWLIFAAPLCAVLVLAFYTRRFIRGVVDFLAAGRVCGRYVISVADVANALAVVTLVAQVEMNYKTGFALTFWQSVVVPLTIFMGLSGYVIYRYRETRALSLGQFLEIRYCRSMRIFGSGLRIFAETLCNMIVPAVSARFFICLIGFPAKVPVFGVEVSVFALIIIAVLLLALFIIWCGGTVALIITDSVQTLISYPIFAVLVIFVLCNFSWFDQMMPVMTARVEGESFLNPYDIQSLRDFNLFALIVTLMTTVLNRGSWIGGGSTCSGRNPHEQKMAGILGAWRNGFSLIFYFLMGAIVITFLTHHDFREGAGAVRSELVRQAAAETVASPAARAALQQECAALNRTVHDVYRGKKLSQEENVDTPYLDAAKRTLADRPEKFQEFRTLYYQLMLPATIRHLLPVGLTGLFALLMIMLMLSTDDSRIFSGAMTLVQDVVMPLYGKPIPPRQHIWFLRGAALFIGVCFFCGSFFMSQLDYINLFSIITTSIWCGGAGPVIVGGLYTRFGNSKGAYASLFSGILISGGGVLVQRNWAGTIYPWLERIGWAKPLGVFLETVSRPFHPYVVWRMDAVKFPINSNELFFLSMVVGIIAYCLVSFLTYKEPFNLDRMLHRGVYGDGGTSVLPPHAGFWRTFWQKLIGIDANYTAGDKVIAWSVFLYTIVYSFGIMFVGVVIWNRISPWPLPWWEKFFFFRNLAEPGVIAVVSTLWFTVGGIIDLKRMFRDLAMRKDDPLDDGRVSGHVMLADLKDEKTEKTK